MEIPKTFKCAFCDFEVEKTIHTEHRQADGTMQVYNSGWLILQNHCSIAHANEPAVKELLFSDWEVGFGYDIDDGKPPNLLFHEEGLDEAFIEPEDEEWL